MAEVTSDLNQVISSAVLARVETEVAKALSGSELMSQYVAAALSEKITVRDGGYRDRKTTFLRETIDAAIKAATKAAVIRVVEAESDALEKMVETELRKQIKGIAKSLVGQVSDSVKSTYGLTVELKYAGRGD